jgi:general secretion pathway protein C
MAAGLLWLAAGLSAGYWFLQVKGQGAWTPVQGLAPSAPQADTATVARALGATLSLAPAAAAPSAPVARLQLLGVVVQGRQQGAALIAVDGLAARPWRVGAEVADGLVLQSVGRRSIQLGETRSGPTTLELAMPPQPADGTPG